MSTPKKCRSVKGRNERDQALDSAIIAERDRLVAWLKRKYNHADAEDFAQEAILRARRNKHRYDPRKCSLKTWLFGIARNLAFDEMRRRKRADLVELDALSEDVGPTVDGPAEIYERKARKTRFYKALLRLPREQRFALILHIMNDYPYPVVAARLRIKPEEARYQVKKGLAALAILLRE